MRAVAWSPSEDALATGGKDGQLLCWAEESRTSRRLGRHVGGRRRGCRASAGSGRPASPG
ncbi:MAG: hypothetical protein HGA65_01300 [Oscillochloris sp.]|nr:hypothetical protein [Oscillochloris sp.]